MKWKATFPKGSCDCGATFPLSATVLTPDHPGDASAAFAQIAKLHLLWQCKCGLQWPVDLFAPL